MNGNDIDHVLLFGVAAFAFALECIEKHLLGGVRPRFTAFALCPSLGNGGFDPTRVERYLLRFVRELIGVGRHLIGRVDGLGVDIELRLPLGCFSGG